MRRYGSGNGGFREAMPPGETGYSGSWKGVSMWTTVLSYLILFMVFVNFPRELSAKDQRRLDRLCPVRILPDDYPPILMVHGTADTDVPYSLSADMAKAPPSQTPYRRWPSSRRSGP